MVGSARRLVWVAHRFAFLAVVEDEIEGLAGNVASPTTQTTPALLAHTATQDAGDLARLNKVVDYVRAHFVDPDYPEWYGYLDREGRVTHRFKGGPYKGCFHVPRALWLSLRLLDSFPSKAS